jgi:U2 small nuclear ribonucleoprotein A'
MKYYRLYTIYKLPNLRVLDFQKVKFKERVFAKNLFESEKGQKIIEDMMNKKMKEDEEVEYFKAMEVINKDLNKQKFLYVRL